MKRDASNYLIQWNDSLHRKPLICRGARQVGKTWLIEAFAKKHFQNHLTVNFEREPHLKKIFQNLSPHEILNELSVIKSQKITPGRSLLFLDEIQGCPDAIKSLRYFYEELPQLHVIAAGSLLDIVLSNENISMPVGRVEYLYVYPISFKEFLSAVNETGLLEYLKDIDHPQEISVVIHEKLKRLLKQYFIVGGMPEVVQSFIEHNDYTLCGKIQAGIIETFRDDFGKYSKAIYWDRLIKIFYTVPKTVGSKFKYVHVSSQYKARDLKAAITLLEKAQIIQYVKLTSGSGLPLEATAREEHFKLLFLDIGLMQKICGLSSEIVLTDPVDLIHRGSLTEQFVGQELLAYSSSFEHTGLYYWHKEGRSNAEVDYLVSVDADIIPLEVKSGKSGTLKSMHQFMMKYQKKFGIKVSSQPISLLENTILLLNLPLYLLFNWKQIVRNIRKNHESLYER